MPNPDSPEELSGLTARDKEMMGVGSEKKDSKDELKAGAESEKGLTVEDFADASDALTRLASFQKGATKEEVRKILEFKEYLAEMAVRRGLMKE